jgi:hypothetical protein
MNQNELKQPFFAQFLQSEKKEDKQQHETSAKESAVTLKYPSDRDEDPRDY